MSLGVRKQLGAATRITDGLIAALGDCCERIEPAGGVSRHEQLVGDLDLVAIPKRQRRQARGQVSLLEGPPERDCNLLYERVRLLSAELLADDRRRIYPVCATGLLPTDREPEVYQRWYDERDRYEQSRKWRLWLPKHGIAVELYLATPETWGCVMAVRNGPAELSKALVQRFTRTSGGGRMDQRRLVLPGSRVLKTPEERNVFEAVGWEWIPPHQRRGPWSMRDCKARYVVDDGDDRTVIAFDARWQRRMI